MGENCPIPNSTVSEIEMTETIVPKNESELTDAVKAALADKTPLAISGADTKGGLGHPVLAKARLSLGAHSGITYYEPGELVMEASSGTPLSEINAALSEHNQQLAFEPPDFGPLFGAGPDLGTIGGVYSCNLSGPRRPFSGAARDHILAIRCVSGRGEVFVSGGRVVKNVTGYDMSKLVTGSYGTLAVLSQVTFKVLPRARSARTILVFGQKPDEALGEYGLALEGLWEISGAAYLEAKGAARSAVDYVAGAGRAVTAMRLEGAPGAVAERAAGLRKTLSEFSETEELHTHNSQIFWREIADGTLLPKHDGQSCETLWRFSMPPGEVMLVIDRIFRRYSGEIQLDWAGGIAWLALDAPKDGESIALMADRMRRYAAPTGGNITLFRASEDVRSEVDVFHPEPAPLAALSKRIKNNFDPEHILNPGRMFKGV
jgi:glycolate oxidase FAD binding subunit